MECAVRPQPETHRCRLLIPLGLLAGPGGALAYGSEEIQQEEIIPPGPLSSRPHKGSGNPIAPKILDLIVVFFRSGEKFL